MLGEIIINKFEVIVDLEKYYHEYEKEVTTKKVYVSSYRCPRCGETHLSGDLALNASSVLSPDNAKYHICIDCALDDKYSLNQGLDDFLKWKISDPNFHV